MHRANHTEVKVHLILRTARHCAPPCNSGNCLIQLNVPDFSLKEMKPFTSYRGFYSVYLSSCGFFIIPIKPWFESAFHISLCYTSKCSFCWNMLIIFYLKAGRILKATTTGHFERNDKARSVVLGCFLPGPAGRSHRRWSRSPWQTRERCHWCPGPWWPQSLCLLGMDSLIRRERFCHLLSE